MPKWKGICCQSTTRHFHAAITIQFTILGCKTHKHYACSCSSLEMPGTLTQLFDCDLQRLSCKAKENYAHGLHKLQLHNRLSTLKRKNDDFEALLKKEFQKEITNAKIGKKAAKAPLATSMLPLKSDLRFSAAKHTSITPAAAAAWNLYAAIRLRSAKTELQSRRELRTRATQIAACSSKTGSRR